MAGLIISGFRVPAALCGVVCVLAAAPVFAGPSASHGGWPPDGSFIRVTRDGGVSPFSLVSYDVTVRGSTLVVTLVKDTSCRTSLRERVVLLGGDAALRVISRLREAGAWSVHVPGGASPGRAVDADPPGTSPRYEFWWAEGDQMTRFYVSGELLDGDPALVGLSTALREVVRGLVDPLPMRDVFHPADEIGLLAMTASEPANAVIDGWDRVRLPVSALDLKAGVHEVTVTGRSGASRSFTVRIVAGETSTIHVLLDDTSRPPRQ